MQAGMQILSLVQSILQWGYSVVCTDVQKTLTDVHVSTLDRETDLWYNWGGGRHLRLPGSADDLRSLPAPSDQDAGLSSLTTADNADR